MFDSKAIYRHRDGSTRYIIDQDDLQFYLDDDGLTEADVEILPISEATADEYAELVGSELENENYHSLVSVTENVLRGLRAQNIDEAVQLQVVKIVGDALLSGI